MKFMKKNPRISSRTIAFSGEFPKDNFLEECLKGFLKERPQNIDGKTLEGISGLVSEKIKG